MGKQRWSDPVWDGVFVCLAWGWVVCLGLRAVRGAVAGSWWRDGAAGGGRDGAGSGRQLYPFSKIPRSSQKFGVQIVALRKPSWRNGQGIRLTIRRRMREFVSLT